ncbi:WG repeat-containing protein [Myxococcota bacterium]|nr:WG repeat-containing protein [Myxococcota bacterium]
MVVEPPVYSLVSGSGEGYFQVEAGSFSGILDRSGREVVPPRYHEVWHDGVGQEPWAVVINGRAHESNASWGGRFGLVNHRGQEMVPPRYDQLDTPQDGRARFLDGSRFGYLDLSGKIAIPARFAGARNFSEGLACVNVGGRRRHHNWIPDYILGGKWGYIDTAGRWRVPPKLDDCSWFLNGRAPVNIGCIEDPREEYMRRCNSGLWGMMDPDGRWILKPKWSQITLLHDRLPKTRANPAGKTTPPRYLVCQKHPAKKRKGPTESCGVMDGNARTIIPLEHSHIRRYGDRLLVVDHQNQYGLFTVDGRALLKSKWSRAHAEAWVERQERSAATTDSNPSNPDDPDDDWSCGRFQEPDARIGRKGRACHRLVRLPSGAWVCQDAGGRQTALPGVTRVADFNGRFAPVQVGDRWGFIDTNGKMAVAPNLTASRVYPRLCGHSLGTDEQDRELFFYELEGQLGTLTSDGRFEVSPTSEPKSTAPDSGENSDLEWRRSLYSPDWVSLHSLESGYGPEWSEIDQWQEKLEKEYDSVMLLDNGHLLVTSQNRQGLVDGEGRWIIPLKKQQIRELGPTFVRVCASNGRCDDDLRGAWRLTRLDGRPAGSETYADLRALPGGFIAFRRPCPPRKRCVPGPWGLLDRDGVVSFEVALEAQEPEPHLEVDVSPVPQGFTGKQPRPSSLRDIHTGQAHPERFDRMEPFIGDRFWVNQGCAWKPVGKYGWTCVGGRWGLWKPGQGMLHPYAFEAILDVTGPWTTVGNACVPDPNGEMKCTRQGVVDLLGKLVVPVVYRQVITHDAPDDYPASCRRQGAVDAGTVVVSNDAGKTGLVDLTGRQVVPLEYDLVCPPQHGVARVMVEDDRSPNRLYGAWGLVALGGRQVLPVEYGYISDFRDGVARFNEGGYCLRTWGLRCRGGRWGLMRPDGSRVVEPRFDWISPLRDGRARTEQRPRFGLLRVGKVNSPPATAAVLQVVQGQVPNSLQKFFLMVSAFHGLRDSV